MRHQQAPASGAVRQDGLPLRKETIHEPALPIIDPHHHLGSRYLLDDLLQDTGSGHNIVATVFIQAFAMYREKGPVAMRPVGETDNSFATSSNVSASGPVSVTQGKPWIERSRRPML